MDNMTQLFIRACKVYDSEKRLRSIYRRFFLSTLDENDVRRGLTINLVSICDKYLNVSVRDMVVDMNPDKYPGLFEPRTYPEAVLFAVTGFIRMADKDKFKGLAVPARFRNKEKVVTHV